MPTAANIVINDGQTTPAATTFGVESASAPLSTFAERSSGVFAKFRRLTLRYLPASFKQRSVKTSYAVSVPIWGVQASGAEGVIRTLRARVEYDIPDGSTDGEKKDLHAFVVNGLSNVVIANHMRGSDPVY